MQVIFIIHLFFPVILIKLILFFLKVFVRLNNRFQNLAGVGCHNLKYWVTNKWSHTNHHLYIRSNLKLTILFKRFFDLTLLELILFLYMGKGFATNSSMPQKSKKRVVSNEPQGRLISWSPWPPANFQTRYPAFPFVLTILILVIGQWYLSLLR